MASKRKNTENTEIDNLLASIGFIFPRTEKELESFNELYSDYDYELKDFHLNPEELTKDEMPSKLDSSGISKKKIHSAKNNYFKRAVLAAEIASQLHSEPTFGHVKLQKLMFLCEQVGNMDINHRYSKQAAGPYDNKFMHSIDYELEKQKWFKVKKEKKGNLTRFMFVPLENFEGHKLYYERYFSKFDDKIQWLINTFRKEKTDKVELIATLYACWLEIIENKQIASDTKLLSLLYNWSDEKKKFSEDSVKKAIQWMKDNGITPELI